MLLGIQALAVLLHKLIRNHTLKYDVKIGNVVLFSLRNMHLTPNSRTLSRS
jgi:hypothetical protein